MTHWWGSSNFWLGVCRPLRSLGLFVAYSDKFSQIAGEEIWSLCLAEKWVVGSVWKVQEREFPFNHWLNLSIFKSCGCLSQVLREYRSIGRAYLFMVGLFKEMRNISSMDFVAEVAWISGLPKRYRPENLKYTLLPWFQVNTLKFVSRVKCCDFYIWTTVLCAARFLLLYKSLLHYWKEVKGLVYRITRLLSCIFQKTHGRNFSQGLKPKELNNVILKIMFSMTVIILCSSLFREGV